MKNEVSQIHITCTEDKITANMKQKSALNIRLKELKDSREKMGKEVNVMERKLHNYKRYLIDKAAGEARQEQLRKAEELRIQAQENQRGRRRGGLKPSLRKPTNAPPPMDLPKPTPTPDLSKVDAYSKFEKSQKSRMDDDIDSMDQMQL